MLAVGILVGCVVGAAYARARRGWDDYQKTKASVPGLRKLAWLLIRVAATKVGIVVLLLVGAVAYAAVGSDDETAGPAPSPSATQSEPPHR
ncbi:hypothetical protein GA0070607_1285 [Micromonospora coriariae]|uniref:Uncharacterized protein n=2 Tax=Micromonospora coriariae TaxID=285665 RepID=A0A1C4UY92_9ACTN|nr:hypothetical protein GA0070607_1285 [Micromonospora coriariae]